MVMLGKFDDIVPDVVMRYELSTHIKSFIKGSIKKQSTAFELQCIEKAQKVLKMSMNISKAEACVLNYASLFFDRLEQIGYGQFFIKP